jgi:hypothetical protein
MERSCLYFWATPLRCGIVHRGAQTTIAINDASNSGTEVILEKVVTRLSQMKKGRMSHLPQVLDSI